MYTMYNDSMYPAMYTRYNDSMYTAHTKNKTSIIHVYTEYTHITITYVYFFLNYLEQLVEVNKLQTVMPCKCP